MSKEQDNLEKLLKKRNEIIKAYNNGTKDYFGDKTFDEMIEENSKSILSAYSNMNKYRESILDLIEGQAEAEINALQKVIDKRKEALSRKKEYYDYDRTIKNKTKDLQSLEQQIRALEGVSGQEAAAKRADLMAQRDEAQEDLNDTVKEHIYNMQVQGLDEMMSGLKDNLDEWKESLHSDIETQNAVINDAIGSITDRNIDGSIASLLSNISQTTVTKADIASLMSASSQTTAKSTTQTDTRAGNTVSTSPPAATKSTASSSSSSSSANKSSTAATPKATVKATTNNTTKASSTTAKTTTKQTVTKANAEKALKIMMDNLIYHETEGKEWGALNKALWRKQGLSRRVYVKHEKLVKAWKQMGFAEKNYSGTNLMNALKQTGAWAQLEAVRTDGKKIKKPKLDYSKIKGYAKGGTVHKSGRYLTDEKGEEIIITKQGILRPLSAGTSVIPADITERLYAIASNYDMNSRIHSPNFQNIQRNSGETIAPIINCPITIEGNANEQDVINAINKTLPKISKHVQNDIRKDLRKSGR